MKYKIEFMIFKKSFAKGGESLLFLAFLGKRLYSLQLNNIIYFVRRYKIYKHPKR